jgi:hypothetical protein
MGGAKAMKFKILGTLVVALLFFQVLTPMMSSGEVSSRYFGVSMTWDLYNVHVLPNYNFTANLSIGYSGPPETVNLTFTTTNGLNCSLRRIDDIHLVQGKNVNFTLNISTSMAALQQSLSRVNAIITNQTYSMYEIASLYVNVLYPLKVEPRFSEIISSSDSPMYGGPINILCNHYPNTLTFAVTNLLPDIILEGYLNLYMNYRAHDGPKSLNVLSQDILELTFNKTQIVNLTIPVLDAEITDWETHNGQLYFIDSFHPKEPITLYNFDLGNGTVKSAKSVSLDVMFKCSLSLHVNLRDEEPAVSPYWFPSRNYWNGTNLTIRVDNLDLNSHKGMHLMILDMPWSLNFDTVDLWNYTEVWHGDIAPLEEFKINTTVYS